jgi:threonine synthase
VKNKIIKDPHTLATAIKIGNPASWKQAVAARDESGGLIDMVTDAQIVTAYKLIAAQEGVFAEPASAASVAGFFKTCEKWAFQASDEYRLHINRTRLKRPGPGDKKL